MRPFIRVLFPGILLSMVAVPPVVATAVPSSGAPSVRQSHGLRGDFNGDGFADLALGAPFEGLPGGLDAAGAVNVIYGGPGGLDANAGPGNQFWTQDSPGIPDDAELGDEFGRFLGVGDFNGDGFADLAVGAPFENVGPANGAGGVNVIYGGPGGLDGAAGPGGQFWTQDSPDVLDQSEPKDTLGFDVEGGDFNGDGYDDLAMAASSEGIEPVPNAGSVNVIYGGPDGLDALAGPGNQFWSQASPGIPDDPESGEQFAFRITSADFNGDGFDELVIGVPSESLGDIPGAGSVHVIYGSAAGLDASAGPGNQFWNQDSPDVLDQAEDNDLFGRGLIGGDFNGDGFADLGVGAITETVGDIQQAGATTVIYGSAGGLDANAGPGNQFWTQDSPGVLEVAESKDHFGRALASGDFNGDGFAELAIGVSGESVGTVTRAGAVNVLYGSAAGLSALGDQFWSQDSNNVLDQSESDDLVGRIVDQGDFDGRGYDDLVMAAPGEDLDALSGAGSANVIYGGPMGLRARLNQFWNQDSPDIQDQAEVGDRLGWDAKG